MSRPCIKNQGSSRDPTTWVMAVRGFGEMGMKVGVLIYLFYRSMALVGIVGIMAGIYGIRVEKKRVQKRWQNQINLEFREGLQGIAAALNAGYSIENALEEAEKDLKLLYGQQSVLAPEFQEVLAKVRLNYPVEKALTELADRSGVEDIRRFAEVFQIAKRTGGDLIAITRTTADRISEKIEVRREIETMIAGKGMEVKVMNVIPLGIILYFWICSPTFLDCLYQGEGRIFMTGLLVMYLLAYNWSERISRISI